MFRIIKHVSNDDYPSSYLVTKYVYCLVSKVTADSEAVCYCTFMFILRLRCNWCCCGLVTKLYPTLLDYMDWSPPGSPVHEISQARILEWVAISFSRGSAQPRNRTHISFVFCIGRQILYHWATWEAQQTTIKMLNRCDSQGRKRSWEKVPTQETSSHVQQPTYFQTQYLYESYSHIN